MKIDKVNELWDSIKGEICSFRYLHGKKLYNLKGIAYRQFEKEGQPYILAGVDHPSKKKGMEMKELKVAQIHGLKQLTKTPYKKGQFYAAFNALFFVVDSWQESEWDKLSDGFINYWMAKFKVVKTCSYKFQEGDHYEIRCLPLQLSSLGFSEEKALAKFFEIYEIEDEQSFAAESDVQLSNGATHFYKSKNLEAFVRYSHKEKSSHYFEILKLKHATKDYYEVGWFMPVSPKQMEQNITELEWSKPASENGQLYIYESHGSYLKLEKIGTAEFNERLVEFKVLEILDHKRTKGVKNGRFFCRMNIENLKPWVEPQDWN